VCSYTVHKITQRSYCRPDLQGVFLHGAQNYTALLL